MYNFFHEMEGAQHGTDKNCTHKFSQKIYNKEITSEIKAQIKRWY